MKLNQLASSLTILVGVIASIIIQAANDANVIHLLLRGGSESYAKDNAEDYTDVSCLADGVRCATFELPDADDSRKLSQVVAPSPTPPSTPPPTTEGAAPPCCTAEYVCRIDDDDSLYKCLPAVE